MTCREFVDFMIDYETSELPGDARQTFEQHLGACGDCVRYLATYRQTITLCREAFALSDEEVPADIPEELVQAILAAQRLL